MWRSRLLPFLCLCGRRGTSACAGAAGRGENNSTMVTYTTKTWATPGVRCMNSGACRVDVSEFVVVEVDL